MSLQAVNIESNTILYTVTAVVLYSDCTCPPRIGLYTELLLERDNDVSSTYVVTKQDGCNVGGLFKEHITHVHECIANATAAANWPVIG